MPCGPPWPVTLEPLGTYPATWWYHVPRTWRMWFEQRHWNWWKLGLSDFHEGKLDFVQESGWKLRWLAENHFWNGCCFICHGSILGAILCSFYRLGFFFCGSSVSLPHWASPHERLFVGSRHLLSSNSAALILVSSGEKKSSFYNYSFTT